MTDDDLKGELSQAKNIQAFQIHKKIKKNPQPRMENSHFLQYSGNISTELCPSDQVHLRHSTKPIPSKSFTELMRNKRNTNFKNHLNDTLDIVERGNKENYVKSYIEQ